MAHDVLTLDELKEISHALVFMHAQYGAGIIIGDLAPLCQKMDRMLVQAEADAAPKEMTFVERLFEFQQGCNAKANENLSEQLPYTIKIVARTGRRYVKMIRTEVDNTDGSEGPQSVFCFVDTKNGDVLKAASWNTPAKHARGNIYNDDFGLNGVNAYGANYL